MAKKAGHPSKEPLEELSETVSLRLSESERIEFSKVAERCGLSLAEWMRDRLNEAAKREAKEA
jgi:predicted HicB family RNase H-like nuclease